MELANLRDVATRAGVSVGTVSNVLNHPAKVSVTTYQRVQGAIQELGFSRNDAARQLRAGTSRAIGLIVGDAGNPFFSDLARGAERMAASLGLMVLLGNSGGDASRQESYLEQFEQQRVRGVLISPIGDVFPLLQRLRSRGIPAVVVDQTAEGTGFSSVAVDDIAGGRMATEHLLDGGDRRICFVGQSASVRQIDDRLLGARDAIRNARGATLDVIATAGNTVQDGVRAARELLYLDPRLRPEAAFCANDLLAIGFARGLVFGDRLRVPRNLRLIGYDDIDFASSAAVAISSVRQPSAILGETAVRILDEEASATGLAPRHIVYQPELVIRSSSRHGF